MLCCVMFLFNTECYVMLCWWNFHYLCCQLVNEKADARFIFFWYSSGKHIGRSRGAIFWLYWLYSYFVYFFGGPLLGHFFYRTYWCLLDDWVRTAFWVSLGNVCAIDKLFFQLGVKFIWLFVPPLMHIFYQGREFQSNLKCEVLTYWANFLNSN